MIYNYVVMNTTYSFQTIFLFNKANCTVPQGFVFFEEDTDESYLPDQVYNIC